MMPAAGAGPDHPDGAVVAGRLQQIADLRAGAAELRQRAADVPPVLAVLAAHDRPDVWEGGRATWYRAEVAEATRRVVSPWSGAVHGIAEAAARLEARASALESTLDPPSW
jgi:hypothetical protein